MARKLSERAKEVARASGANLVGIVAVERLPEHSDSITDLLPAAKSVVVTATKHSLAAIRSSNIQLAQYDTIHTYGEVGRAAHQVARFLMGDVARRPPEEVDALLQGDGLRELWQTFMTGNYYYCFRCQAQCPATELPRLDG